MHILGKLQDDRFLHHRFLATERDVLLLGLHLAPQLAQHLRVLVHDLHLLLKHLLQIEQLLLQVVDLLVLRLQTCAHLLSPVGQHVLRLPQILNLELVLVQISRPLFQFLNHLLILQLKQLYLLGFLLQQFHHILPLRLCH